MAKITYLMLLWKHQVIFLLRGAWHIWQRGNNRKKFWKLFFVINKVFTKRKSSVQYVAFSLLVRQFKVTISKESSRLHSPFLVLASIVYISMTTRLSLFSKTSSFISAVSISIEWVYLMRGIQHRSAQFHYWNRILMSRNSQEVSWVLTNLDFQTLNSSKLLA